MSSKGSSTPPLHTVLTGLVFPEQPRWHEGRLWFSDWGTQDVMAVDLKGKSEVILKGPSFPMCVDWLPDGRLLIVSARGGLLLRREPYGSLVTHADLTGVSKLPPGNELVVDGSRQRLRQRRGLRPDGRWGIRPRDHRPGHPRWLRPAGGR